LFTNVQEGSDDVEVGEGRKLFEVAVGDVTVGIGVGHEAVPNGRREGRTPDHWAGDVREENSTETKAGGIGGTNDAGCIRDDFSQAGGTLGEALYQPQVTKEVAAQMASDANP
jgi:hypothetical protein